MNIEPKRAYVYQPRPPRKDGRFYAVAGLDAFGIHPDDAKMGGLTKSDAEEIARQCNERPQMAAGIIQAVKVRQANDWLPDCGCRFESLFSNTVQLCEECSHVVSHSLAKGDETHA